MLIVHELHEVIGAREDEFEDAVRRRWLPALAETGEAKLLFFLHHAHGSGASYQVVTLTAVRDADAWGRLVTSVDTGSLGKLAAEIDELRHDVTAKILVPLPWSPWQQVDLDAVPTDPAERDPFLYMEDTVWPREGLLEQYVEASGNHYAQEIGASDAAGQSILRIEGSFRTAYGSARRREILLWQRIVRPKALQYLFAREVPEEFKAPGTWMHEALRVRDRWESRLLRTARWSPWPVS